MLGRRPAIIASLVCLLVCTPVLAYAAADGPALVHVTPASLTLRPGEVGSVTLSVDNADDVYGVELHLRFDPAIVEVVDPQTGQPAAAIASGEWLRHGFVALNRASNAAGTIDYAVTLVNPAPPLSGSGPVAVITFKGKAAGAGALTVQQAIVASRQGKEIASQWQHGAITVAGGAPLAAAGSSEAPSAPPTTAPTRPDSPQQAGFGATGLALAAFAALAVAMVGILVWRRR